MSEDLAPTAPETRPGLIRRLYAWTISWADRPGGSWALFAIAFAESSFFPIPPDVLLLALCFGARKKWARYALICTAGSVVGGIAGWLIGWGLRESVALPLLNAFDSSGAVRSQIEGWYEAYGFWGILIAAITPIPYKVFTVFSGMMTYNLPMLILASILGRGFRFFVVAGIIRLFGPKVRPFIEKHLEWCFLAFGVLVVVGIVALKFFH
ncbi:membrane protein YqaA with SNARE-associated domain [Haloferula luteola]|uniref:Membrane protein YqaA with SNARE-associated domain n=1 Tax=Haloferula luteola TaxID=595692 RepID=A0A840VGZ6_9BACT|nr:YqaA family protein [Haloferula luteola]MBB5352051.1 membrane protein YqaA with SNARE-associated domain [Haloferula luteola]